MWPLELGSEEYENAVVTLGRTWGCGGRDRSLSFACDCDWCGCDMPAEKRFRPATVRARTDDVLSADGRAGGGCDTTRTGTGAGAGGRPLTPGNVFAAEISIRVSTTDPMEMIIKKGYSRVYTPLRAVWDSRPSRTLKGSRSVRQSTLVPLLCFLRAMRLKVMTSSVAESTGADGRFLPISTGGGATSSTYGRRKPGRSSRDAWGEGSVDVGDESHEVMLGVGGGPRRRERGGTAGAEAAAVADSRDMLLWPRRWEV